MIDKRLNNDVYTYMHLHVLNVAMSHKNNNYIIIIIFLCAGFDLE